LSVTVEVEGQSEEGALRQERLDLLDDEVPEANERRGQIEAVAATGSNHV
jgi:hypothetical protein